MRRRPRPGRSPTSAPRRDRARAGARAPRHLYPGNLEIIVAAGSRWTVDLAAQAHGVEPAQVAKTIRLGVAIGRCWSWRAALRLSAGIRKLFTEGVAPRPGIADMLVEINDEQRPGWFLSYSVGLWRGRIGTVALPLVDFLQRSSHERCLIVLGQAFGVAERRDALLIGQHADRPRPVGAPHASIQPERIDDPQYRLPELVVWERLVRHRAGTADLHPYVLVLSQGEQLGKIGPNVAGDQRATPPPQPPISANHPPIHHLPLCPPPLSPR